MGAVAETHVIFAQEQNLPRLIACDGKLLTVFKRERGREQIVTTFPRRAVISKRAFTDVTSCVTIVVKYDILPGRSLLIKIDMKIQLCHLELERYITLTSVFWIDLIDSPFRFCKILIQMSIYSVLKISSFNLGDREKLENPTFQKFRTFLNLDKV